jgi:hypothetical protein
VQKAFKYYFIVFDAVIIFVFANCCFADKIPCSKLSSNYTHKNYNIAAIKKCKELYHAQYIIDVFILLRAEG